MPDAVMPSPESPSVELDPKEKAKLDYQMSLEKGKSVYIYERVRFREMLWDRGIFGLVVALVGTIAILLMNRYLDKRRNEDAQHLEKERKENAQDLESRRKDDAQSLEKYRFEEARKRFLMEKRLEALATISAAHNSMTSAFFRYIDASDASLLDKAKADHSAGIDRFIEAINRNLPVLTVEFDKEMNYYLQVHRSLRGVGPAKWATYGNYASELDNQFNDLCRSFLQTGELNEDRRMTLKPIPYAERMKMTSEQYLDAQVTYFEQHKK
jgi:hypothetical protein